MMLRTAIKYVLRCGFMRREDGNITLEAVILMPLLFWTYLAMFSIFDVYRNYNLTQKATYTIGDAISRETTELDDDYLDGMRDLFDMLTNNKGTSSIRVSSIWFDATNDRYYRDWSQIRGSVVPLTDADVAQWHDRLPVMPNKERVMLVETWNTYDPPFKTGLEQTQMANSMFTRPRYATWVCWEVCPEL